MKLINAISKFVIVVAIVVTIYACMQFVRNEPLLPINLGL